MNDEPVPPSKLQPKIPRDIETICLKCLHKEPERRYESAEALANDLARFCRGEPILARPVGNFERMWRWCRRNPWVAVPSAAAALLALAVMIGAPIAAAIIYQQKEKAVVAQGLAEKNEKIADRNAELADQQKEIAKEQRVLALETLNKVVTQVEQELRDRSELNDLRQSVLSLALDGLDQVSRTDENADLADRSIGAAHQRMGEILTRAGKADEALSQYQKALGIFERLLKEDKNNDLARWNSALTYDGIGDVKNKTLDDAQVVRKQFQYALHDREILTTRGPQLNPKIQPFMIEAALVNSHARLGNVSLQSFCDPGAAVESFQQAAKHAEALLASLPDHPVAKQSLSGSWYVLAQALYRMGRTDEADELVAKAMATRQSLLDDAPQSIKAQQDVAVTHWLKGDVLLRDGQNEQALAAYETAHALRLKLFENDQENPEMQEDLARSYYRVGTAYRSLARNEDAQAAFAECLSLNEKVLAADPENKGKLMQLALVQARCGQVEEAAQITDTLRSSLYPNPGTLFRLARSYSLCALALQEDRAEIVAEEDHAEREQGYLNAALESLREAIHNGFKDPYELRFHPDLVALRKHPDFKALLADLN
jgi:tetratricopeptide (TPR) repeat protein